ncbi:glycosyltransferase family 4 protein [uncultured Ferrimonas sp.]|uniref:glycosyltransferase family 4 protein n=1 Tax=uncultured Ferrimonas sp. TaxID=432640 RepID=UPI002636ED22|nr:glycosyltransferase family 4 protein [uncultured Ferrimonas sp.]
MKKMKKVIFVTNNIRAGGAERVCVNLANELSQLYDLTIVSGESQIHDFYELKPEVERKSLAFDYMSKSILGKVVELYNRIGRLSRFIKSERPDVVVSFGLDMNVLSRLATLVNNNVKVICCEHNNHNALANGIKVKIRNFVYRKADLLTALTEYDKRYYLSKNVNCIVVNNPVVSLGVSCSLPRNKFLFVGRLEEQKNIPGLLDVIEKIIEVEKESKFSIVGDGSKRQFLLEQIELRGLSNSVNYLGNQKEIGKLYASHRCLMLVSHYEGLPMVLIEAQDAGLPQVSYDCPTGPAEIISDESTGYLIEHYDIDGFVKKVIKLNNDDNLAKKYSKESKIAAEEYSIDRVVKKWVEIIDGVTE